MVSGIEGVGEAVTGGMLARAVEPERGEADRRVEGNCLNCGAPLAGEYCHRCGQKGHVHRTLKGFWHDLVHGAFHFEGKIWRTLPLLAWRPGELTRRYIDGQRARFVSPIALFLFSVFLMFAVMELTGALDPDAGRAMQTELAKEVEKARENVAELTTDRAEAVSEGRSTAGIDSQLSEARAELVAIQAAQARRVDANALRSSPDMPGWLGGMVDNASKNPELLFYKIKTNAYKFSWALIPISVPFVWLLFPFSRRFRMYDHTVFGTYSLSFMTLLLIVGSTIELVSPSIAGLLWLIPPFHMYRQVGATYGLGRWGALWRTAALVLFACIAIGLFAALLVGLGAAA